jgi:hypothetical protein
MIVKYRGYEIEVKREECLGGWPLLYYSVYRIEDGWCAIESFEDSDETVRDMVGHMKARIDNELAECDPWMEQAEFDDIVTRAAAKLRDQGEVE